MTAVYIHIPFCQSKCPYCSFSSFACDETIHRPYAEAIKRELSSWRKYKPPPITTLFLGGGTPTILAPKLLDDILNHCISSFGLGSGAEISIEANPGTVDKVSLRHLRDSGFNRISFGVQSFDDDELSLLGRIHDHRDAVAAVQAAQLAGFDNINIDLMYGIPGQTVSSWVNNVQTAIKLQPQHLSLYQLTIEEGTAFGRMYDLGQLNLPSEEHVCDMEDNTREVAADNNFIQYEISNWAPPGHQCRHNIVYWQNRRYIGVGAGAVSYWNGVRQRRVESPQTYVDLMLNNKGDAVLCEEEKLDHEACFRETVIMGLRMVEGVNLSTLEERFGIDPLNYYQHKLKTLLSNNFLSVSDTHLFLTEKGRAIANTVMAELV